MRIRNVISRRIIRGGYIIEELTETRVCKTTRDGLKLLFFLTIVILIILTIVRTLKSGC